MVWYQETFFFSLSLPVQKVESRVVKSHQQKGKSFSDSVVKQWNSLPQDVEDEDSVVVT